jgi:mannan endo-1,4-beta-mannosidase
MKFNFMKNLFKRNNLCYLIVLLLITACNKEPEAEKRPAGMPIDANITTEGKALFLNLKNISKEGILFGHQDDLAYGVDWFAEDNRSDVKEAGGAYPAVFGWDVSKLGQTPYNIDSVNFEKMKDWIIQGYQMGGIITISWHMDNPVTKGDSWDKTPAVYSIIPGGNNHEWYKAKLDLFADFLADLKVSDILIPVIFRPYHEHTGDWFWWGRGNCSSEEFIALWQFTVKYLRDEKDIHHLLYAYSTDRFNSEADYLEFYPGDDYVDILAYDDYWSVVNPSGRPELIRQLSTLVKLSDERGKVAALSETGYETIPDEDWWTTVLLPGLTADQTASKIAYVLVWRNGRLDHHYAPYDGHPSAPDFKKFKEDPVMIFIDEIPVDVYTLPY